MIVGTRGSRLAMAQTAEFVRALRQKYPDLEVRIRTVKTTGDILRDRPLSQLGGRGVFVKELDRKLLEGEIDVAVNSLKDMPVNPDSGTEIAAVLVRGPVEDVIIPPCRIEELKPGSIIGTSSARRRAMLLNLRSDLKMKHLRGNVTTRLHKLREGDCDHIILARAGIERLGLEEDYGILDPSVFIPAAGQGAIAVVCRKNSKESAIISSLDDFTTRREVEAERFILGGLGGGCSVPAGVWACREGNMLRIRGKILTPDGERALNIDRAVSINWKPDELTEIVRDLEEFRGSRW